MNYNSVGDRKDYEVYMQNLKESGSTHSLIKPKLFGWLNRDRIIVLLKLKLKEFANITNYTKNTTYDVLADKHHDIAYDRFMTRFWPSEYIMKFNDLAQKTYPDSEVIKNEFVNN